MRRHVGAGARAGSAWHSAVLGPAHGAPWFRNRRSAFPPSPHAICTVSIVGRRGRERRYLNFVAGVRCWIFRCHGYELHRRLLEIDLSSCEVQERATSQRSVAGGQDDPSVARARCQCRCGCYRQPFRDRPFRHHAPGGRSLGGRGLGHSAACLGNDPFFIMPPGGRSLGGRGLGHSAACLGADLFVTMPRQTRSGRTRPGPQRGLFRDRPFLHHALGERVLGGRGLGHSAACLGTDPFGTMPPADAVWADAVLATARPVWGPTLSSSPSLRLCSKPDPTCTTLDAVGCLGWGGTGAAHDNLPSCYLVISKQQFYTQRLRRETHQLLTSTGAAQHLRASSSIAVAKYSRLPS